MTLFASASPGSRRGRGTSISIVLLAVVLAALSGFAISLGVFVVAAIVSLLFLPIFLLAYFGGHQERVVKGFYIAGCAYLVLGLVWPRYVALYIPGLPLVNPQRLANVLMLLMTVVGVLGAAEVRTALRDSISKHLAFWVLLTTFVVWRTISIAFSPETGVSLYQYVNELFVHVFFVGFGVWLGGGKRLRILLPIFIGMAMLVGVVSIYEYIQRKSPFLPFADPSSEYVQWALRNKGRDGGYRSQGPFAHPLMLAEFAAVAVAFCMVAVMSATSSTLLRLFGLIASAFCFVALILSGSRAGYGAALVVPVFLFAIPLLAAAKARRIGLARATVISWVSIGAAVAIGWGLVIVLEHAFGSMASTASNAARSEMYALTIKALENSPIFGAGVGMAPAVIGVRTYAGGPLSVDSFFLTVLAEAGVLGFLAFCGLIFCGIVASLGKALKAEGGYSLQVAVGGALVAMVLFKSILSLQDNSFLFYFLLGIAVAPLCSNSLRGADVS